MGINLIRSFTILVVLLSSSISFALGAQMELKSLEFKAQGTDCPSMAAVESRPCIIDNIKMSYTLGGEARVLWDDDGFATLFLYHRAMAGRVYDGELQVTSPLTQPLTPLFKALDMLEKTYQQFGSEQAHIVAQIQAVKSAARNMKTIQDLKDSGLEALINDLLSNHTHVVERPDGSTIRKPTGELIAVGVSSGITDGLATRCRDMINLNWSDAVKNFSSAAGKGSNGAANQGMGN